jgi:hypothetical protein
MAGAREIKLVIYNYFHAGAKGERRIAAIILDLRIRWDE